MPFGSNMSQSGGKGSHYMVAFAALMLIVVASPAAAQNGAKHDSVGEDAVDAVTQPLTDLNLRAREIPQVLIAAQQTPYDLEMLTSCDALRTEVDRLDAVLGPDADEPSEKEGLLNKGLRTGGNIIGGFLPFRGLVRQLSGANAHEAKWREAIYAGVARRSFLKGYMAGQGCENAEEVAVRSARELLGLPVEADPER